MSSRVDHGNRKGQDQSFILQAMEQYFARLEVQMNYMEDEIGRHAKVLRRVLHQTQKQEKRVMTTLNHGGLENDVKDEEEKEIERRLESEETKECEKNDLKVSKEKEEEKERKEKDQAKQEIEKRKESERKEDLKIENEKGEETKRTEDLSNINNHSLCSVVSSLLQEFEIVFPKDSPSSSPLEKTKEFQCQMEELGSSFILLIPKKDDSWKKCIYAHAINNIMVKIRGRIFSRNGGMMRIGARRYQLLMLIGPIIRAKSKKLLETFNGYVKGVYMGQPII